MPNLTLSMSSEPDSLFEELRRLAVPDIPLLLRYRQLQALISRVCVEETADSHVEYSGLFSRLYAVCRKHGLDHHAPDRARRNARRVLSGETEPSEEGYASDWSAVCRWIAALLARPIPPDIAEVVKTVGEHGQKGTRRRQTATAPGTSGLRLRLTVMGIEGNTITAADHGSADEAIYRVVCPSGDPILRQATPGTQINVLDYTLDGEELHPAMVVFEPDYLIDVSRLAACVKPYGSSPLNYLIDLLTPHNATRYTLLGEAANRFMDDSLNDTNSLGEKEAFVRSMQAHFREHLLDYVTTDEEFGADFFQSALTHFRNIRHTVETDFPAPGIGLHADEMVLEPSFICEALGLRGRLDVMTLDHRNVVELKSGRAQDFGHAPLPQPQHALQMGLYKAILHYNFGLRYDDIRTFLLYSRYPLLYDERTPREAIASAVRLRNEIVALGRQVRRQGLVGILDELTVDKLNEQQMKGKFFDCYLRPPLQRTCALLREKAKVTENEACLPARYFNAFLSFLAREQYLAKIGDNRPDTTRGAARAWTTGFEAKRQAGIILAGLRLRAAEGEGGIERLVFDCPDNGADFLPDFAENEMIQVYEWAGPHDNLTRHQLFRGYVERLAPGELVVRLAYKQRNARVFPSGSLYAVEHDSTDSVTVQGYRGLYQFLSMPPERQALLLGTRLPGDSRDIPLRGNYPNPAVRDIVRAAKQARDYYLLVGPPGTGKTSVALRSMVEEFLLDRQAGQTRALLLAAYTNRAVDEICQTLESLTSSVEYVRIGVAQTCAPAYRHRLLPEWAKEMKSREEIVRAFDDVPIVVGTVATLSARTAMLACKHFDALIVDEASQILEPQLLPLLAASKDGSPLLQKFILIGDHKQLPAVVMQPGRDTRVHDEWLRRIGLTDLANSLFERLYGLLRRHGRTDCYGWLDRQGRMHPDICRYVNRLFYDDRLHPVPLPHQVGELPFEHEGDGLARAIARVRLGFVPVRPARCPGNPKANADEAEAVGALAAALTQLYALNGKPFDTVRQLGVIVPFRNQIPLVRQSLARHGVDGADTLTVDTVECYQGSQRDHIIFSTTISRPYQLALLSDVRPVDGQPVDRKLNVAVTRARMQLFVVGDDRLLRRNPLYQTLIDEAETISFSPKTTEKT